VITGAHVIISSTAPDKDRAFFRDVLGFGHIDAGEGWLIFQLPPAELAVHPAQKNGFHEFYLQCDDVVSQIAALHSAGIACTPVQSLSWGLLTRITLPGGGELGMYQPRHALIEGEQ